jgi:hypothetical protein
MPAFFDLFSQPPTWIVQYSRGLGAVYRWVRPMLIEAAAELLRRGHQWAVDWTTKYVSYLPLFVLLMLCSAYVRVHELRDEFCAAALQGDIPRSKHLAGQIALLMGKITVVRLAQSLSERAQGVVA